MQINSYFHVLISCKIFSLTYFFFKLFRRQYMMFSAYEVKSGVLTPSFVFSKCAQKREGQAAIKNICTFIKFF